MSAARTGGVFGSVAAGAPSGPPSGPPASARALAATVPGAAAGTGAVMGTGTVTGTVAGAGSRTVLGCTLANLVSSTPIVNATFGVFLVPLARDLHWPRARVSLVLAVVALLCSVSYPLVGRCADRFGVRPVALVGNLLFAASVAALSLSSAVAWQTFALFAVLGLTSAIPSTMLFSKLISAWYVQGRGLFLGVAAGIGNGVGSTVMPAFAGAVIASHGWRSAYQALGLVVLVVGLPSILLLMRTPPGARSTRPIAGRAPGRTSAGVAADGMGPAGMAPAAAIPAEAIPAGAMRVGAMQVGAMRAGAPSDEARPVGATPAGTLSAGVLSAGPTPDAAAPDGATLGAAMRTRHFWILLAMMGLGAGSLTALFAHVVPMLTDRGILPRVALLTLAAFALTGSGWQLVLGHILDRSAAPRVIALFFMAAVGGLVLFDGSRSTGWLVVGALLTGLGLGTEYGAMPYLVGRYFGLRAFGAICGLIYGINVIVLGTAPFLMDLVYDATGAYHLALAGIGLCLLACAGLCLLLPRYGRIG